MKGLLIVVTVAALALLIGAGQALAQPAVGTTPPAAGGQARPGWGMGGWHGGFGHFRHFRRPMLGEKLGLTDAQKEQIKTILQDAREKGRADLKAAFEKIKTTVLTDAQRKTLDDMKAKWEARRGAKPEAKPAPAAPPKS